MHSSSAMILSVVFLEDFMFAIRSRRKPWLAKLGVCLFGRLALLGETLALLEFG